MSSRRARQDVGPVQHRWRGVLLRVTGAFLVSMPFVWHIVVLPVLLISSWSERSKDPSLREVIGGFGRTVTWMMITAASVAGLMLGYRLLRRGKRHHIALGPMVMRSDPRPRILYFRAFSDEPQTQQDRFSSRWFHYMGEEELVTAELSKVGPVLAVGDPGDGLPQLGAHRLYLGDADWREAVLKLMDQAAAVVIRMGWGEGLAWEVQQVLVKLPPDRIVFIMPRGAHDYHRLKMWIDPHLPVPLPWYLAPDGERRGGWEWGAKRPHLELLWFLHFDAEWSPHLEVFGSYRDDTPKQMRKEFLRCIGPFVARLAREGGRAAGRDNNT